jgi:hypothetical protein
LSISGSTTQIGNNTLIGTTTLTGSILINGDIIPQISASFNLGSITNPWKTIYLQSGSISIQSDIPGSPDAIISNTNGDISIQSAGFQLISGSTTPFRVDPIGRTRIISPNLIPSSDAGAFQIIGNISGSYQPVTNAGGMIHITGNNEQSSRITNDAYGSGSAAAVVANRKARGTSSSPLPVQANDTLARWSSVGWTGPDYGFTMSASATLASTALETIALENFTTSSFGTRFTFFNAPLGGTIRTLSATIDTTGIQTSGSVKASSFTGSLFGTSSWAQNSSTASYYGGSVTSASYAATSSYAPNYVLTSATASMLSPYVLTSSTSSMSVATASYVQNAQTASYVITAQTASYVTTAQTASYAPNYLLISQTGSFVTTGSNTFKGNQVVSGSITQSGSLTVNGPAIFNDLTVHITGSLLITGSGYINGLPILTSANTSSFTDGFGWYGAFCSTGSQTNPVANISHSMQLDTVEHSNGVSIVSGSRITFAHNGVYNIQFSAQLEKTSNGTDTAYIWFKKNGTNVARSNSNVDIAKAAGGNGKVVASWNYVDTFIKNDYYEVAWQSPDTTMQLSAFSSSGNIPVTPSVIITATQVG